MARNNKMLNPKRGEVTRYDIADAAEEYTKVFGANKNVYRITPSLIDGLKPGQRRMLYALRRNPDRGLKFRKVGRISSDTMAYHPHGDTSTMEVIGKFGQYWNNNVMYLEPQGNFGSIRGDQPGAGRYIEARLSKFAWDCFFSDYDKANVPMKVSYTGDDYEPEYLPAKYPVVLVNPQLSSIGYGLASNIPPFNFNEVMDATIKLIKDPKSKIKLIPDSPTKCDVVDNGTFKEINKTGKSKFTLRATYDIDYFSNVITITSVPLQINVKSVIETLVKMKQDGKLDELNDFNDRTKNGEVDLKLFLKPDSNPDKFIEKIMNKSTGLCITYSCEICVVDDYKTYVYSPKELLLEWIEYRRECIRSIYNGLIVTAMGDHHMNKIMLHIFNKDNADQTIKIAKESKNKEEMKEKLMKKYKITSLQAESIASMRIYQFNKDKYAEFKEKDKRLKEDIKHYEKILDSDDAIDNIIIEQLSEGKKKYGRKRQSDVISLDGEVVKIPDTMHLIGISSDKYIKKIFIENKSIGNVGKTSSVIVSAIGNRENLLIFDSTGKVTRLQISDIPDMDYKDIGVDLGRYVKIDGDIISIITESDIKNTDNNIVLVTEKGIGKKVKLQEFTNIRDFKIAISLDEGDKLVSAIPSLDSDSFIIYTNYGDGIRLNTKDIKIYGKNAKGLTLISLKQNEQVVGIDVLYNNRKKLAYITSSGRLKLTDSKYLPVMKRKDEPITLIGLDSNESLVGICSVSSKDEIVVYQKKSKPTTIKVKDIPVTTRVAKAQKMVKTPKGDNVISFKLIRK